MGAPQEAIIRHEVSAPRTAGPSARTAGVTIPIMPTLLRFLRLLSLVVWVGGLIFFAFVVAPVAFSSLPSTHEAGIVVGGTLRVLHWIGLTSGAIFALATLLSQRTRLLPQLLLVAAMLAATVYLQASVLPAMEIDRQHAGGNIDAAPTTDPARQDFNRLHARSERVEGAVLLAGLLLVFLLAREPATPAKL
jgi:uncharacterized membrane protein